jgi:hypothetical protein
VAPDVWRAEIGVVFVRSSVATCPASVFRSLMLRVVALL